MRKLFILALACVGAATASAADWRGTYQLRVLSGLEGGNLQTIEHSLMPELEAGLPGSARLYARGRLRHDSRDHLEPGAPEERQYRSSLSRRHFLGQRSEAELLELYVDGYAGDTFYRVGKQPIVWGEAIGLTVLDIVNPASLREFVLPDQDERRIPLWSVRVEHPVGPWTARFVWVPDTTYDQLPDSEAPFAFTSPLFASRTKPDRPVELAPPRRPDNPVRDADAGVRFTTFAAGWDVSLAYLYHYNDTPSLRREIRGGRAVFTPTYYRSHTAGGTLSNAFGDFTLRAEAGYSTDRYFHTTAVEESDGLARTPELSAVLGLDYSGITNVLLSAQLFSSHLTRHRPGMARERRQDRATFLVRGAFLNDTLTTEMLLIHSFDHEDGAAQFSLDYRLRSHITLQAGLDLLYGNRRGAFGQFRDEDRLTLGLEYSF